MGKIVFDISMSLDGYMTAAGRTAEQPTGPGGDRLTEWAMGGDEANREYLAANLGGLGAVICGRETYDTSVPWWGADGPSGPTRRPVFVVTHRPPTAVPENGVYTFVTGGIEAALDLAREAAADATVTVMGGASIGQQFIASGLVDEISVHVVPVLFGAGTRMFENLGDGHRQLEATEAICTPNAIHTRFRLVDAHHGNGR